MSAPLSRSHGRLGALLGATLLIAAMMVPATATAAVDLNALAATLEPGDAEGFSGSITMEVNDTPDEVCFVLDTTFSSGDADPPTSVDIQLQNGTQVLHLADGVDVTGGATDCVASTAILNAALLESPANYQVNIITADFPVTGIWGTVVWGYPQTDLNILTVVCPPEIQEPEDLTPSAEATCEVTVLEADDVSGDIPGGYTADNYAGVSDFDYHVNDGVRIDETIADASFPGTLDCDSGTQDCDANGLYYHWSQLSADINVNIDPSVATLGLRVGAVAAFDDSADDVPLTEETDGSFTVDATGVTVTNMIFYLFGDPLPDTTDPTVSTPIVRFKAGGTYGANLATVELTWTGNDIGGSELDRFNVQVSKNGGSWQTVDSSVEAFKLTTTVRRGQATRFRVKAIDGAGNASAWKASAVNELHAVSDGSSRVVYRQTWTKTNVAGAGGGTVRRSTDKAATAKLSFFGRAVAWVAPNGATYGQAKVYIDGKLDATINLNGAPADRLQVYKKTFSKNGGHTITVKVVATAGHPRVDVDAFLYLN